MPSIVDMGRSIMNGMSAPIGRVFGGGDAGSAAVAGAGSATALVPPEDAQNAARAMQALAEGWYESEWRHQQQMEQISNSNPSEPQIRYAQFDPMSGFTAYPTFTFFNGIDMALGAREARPLVPVDEPSRELLKRMPVEVEDLDLADPRQKLAAEAEAVLGYTPLRQELRTPGTLRRVLAKLEIAVLEEAGVDQYKAQMVQHYESTGKMPMPTWRLTPLRQYSQPVPEFVLQKTIEIKRELPEAEFYIDQLAVDPFLIVSLKPIPDWNRNRKRQLDAETAAYVEAWAEPNFEHPSDEDLSPGALFEAGL